jgi:hypothetical protein
MLTGARCATALSLRRSGLPAAILQSTVRPPCGTIRCRSVVVIAPERRSYDYADRARRATARLFVGAASRPRFVAVHGLPTAPSVADGGGRLKEAPKKKQV